MKARNLIAIVSAAIVGLIPSLPLVAAPVSPAHLRVLARKNVAAGGPTLIAEDDFDSYADTTDLGSTANWTNRKSAIYTRKPASDGSFYSGPAFTYWDADAFSSDQRAEVTLDAVSGDGSFEWVGCAVRIQSGAESCYGVVAGSGDIYLIYYSAGASTTITSDTAITLAAGDKLAIECSGAGTAARIKVQIDTGSGWVDKWTDQNPAVDLDGGAPGVIVWAFGSLNSRADDWKGYDL